VVEHFTPTVTTAESECTSGLPSDYSEFFLGGQMTVSVQALETWSESL